MSDPSASTQTLPNLLDDDTLNEHERAFIEIFQKRQTTAEVDDGGLASAEVEPESQTQAQGTPASGSDSTSTPAAPDAPTVEGPDGASATEPSQEPAEPTAPVGGEPTGDEHAQSSPAFTFAGVQYTEDQLSNAVRVHDWFNRLNDQQVRAIDALLSGQYTLQPAHEASPSSTSATPSAPPAPDQSPASTPASTSPPPEQAGDWLDPRAQAEINALKATIEQQSQQFNQLQETLKSSLAPVVQSQQQSQQQQYLQQIDAGTAAFKDQYSLEPSQVEQIQQAVADAGVFPSLIQRHGGDIQAAMRTALDLMFWSTPQFRDPYLSSKTAAEQADIVQQQNSSIRKKQQLTALSASGGSVPRRDPVPQDREGRFAAMVQTIAADQNGQ